MQKNPIPFTQLFYSEENMRPTMVNARNVEDLAIKCVECLGNQGFDNDSHEIVGQVNIATVKLKKTQQEKPVVQMNFYKTTQSAHPVKMYQLDMNTPEIFSLFVCCFLDNSRAQYQGVSVEYRRKDFMAAMSAIFDGAVVDGFQKIEEIGQGIYVNTFRTGVLD